MFRSLEGATGAICAFFVLQSFSLGAWSQERTEGLPESPAGGAPVALTAAASEPGPAGRLQTSAEPPAAAPAGESPGTGDEPLAPDAAGPAPEVSPESPKGESGEARTAAGEAAVPGENRPAAREPGSGEGTADKDSASEAKKDSAASWLSEHFFGRIKVRGYTQFRFNHPTTNPALVNLQGDRSVGGVSEFFVRRARLVLSGDLHPLISIYLQPDFATTTESGLHFAQWRDWYVDLSAPGKEFRLRVGQSKIPFGFENLQSSQNRLPLDRSDAINSALANERDLGIFLYWAPAEIRERFDHLVKSGLKGSGDYGVVGVGAYNGQTANKPELNDNKHVLARVSYPFLFGEQFVEIGGGGYAGQFVISKDEAVNGPDEFWDARGNLALTIYPQPFGLQVEYNIGLGPELTDIREDTSGGESVFRGTVREGFLHGGYALASVKIDHPVIGTLLPYVRGILYEGGKKHETNAPRYSIRELEVGVEWQPVRMLEFTGAFVTAERTGGDFPYRQEQGQMGRFQLQVNY